jgi:hypothetical protein
MGWGRRGRDEGYTEKREGKGGREGKGREGKGREGKGREGKGREGKGGEKGRRRKMTWPPTKFLDPPVSLSNYRIRLKILCWMSVDVSALRGLQFSEPVMNLQYGA